jgi:hypothetical protein
MRKIDYLPHLDRFTSLPNNGTVWSVLLGGHFATLLLKSPPLAEKLAAVFGHTSRT